MVHIKQIFKEKKKKSEKGQGVGDGWPQEELESRTARPCEIQAGFSVLCICSSLCICFFLFLGLLSTA